MFGPIDCSSAIACNSKRGEHVCVRGHQHGAAHPSLTLALTLSFRSLALLSRPADHAQAISADSDTVFDITRNAAKDAIECVVVVPGVSKRWFAEARATGFLDYAQLDGTFLKRSVTGGVLLLCVCSDAFLHRVLLMWAWWFHTESGRAWHLFCDKVRLYLGDAVKGLRFVVDGALSIKSALSVSWERIVSMTACAMCPPGQQNHLSTSHFLTSLICMRPLCSRTAWAATCACFTLQRRLRSTGALRSGCCFLRLLARRRR